MLLAEIILQENLEVREISCILVGFFHIFVLGGIVIDYLELFL